jgi:DDE superfamily endonuclease/Helix-turn-helix of DDE superfamily endonuclease
MKKLLDYIHLHPQKTQALLGISFEDFQQLNEQVKQAHAQNQAQKEAQKVRVNAKGAGRPEKLSLCETIGLCLFYLRHDPTFEVLGMLFEVSKSEAHETFHEGLELVRQVLPASLFEEFGHDPYLWSVVQELLQEEVLLADSTEPARERPCAPLAQKAYYSGKKRQHTQKTQVLSTADGLEIVDVIAGVPGPTADVNLLRQQQERLDPQQQFMGDKAYQGAERTTTPHKKPRKKELTEHQRAENQVISGQRIFIEHRMRRLKIFRILTHRFRLNSRRYCSVMFAICGLVRLRLGRLDFTNYDT